MTYRGGRAGRAEEEVHVFLLVCLSNPLQSLDNVLYEMIRMLCNEVGMCALHRLHRQGSSLLQ
jgi:hypothetical protein